MKGVFNLEFSQEELKLIKGCLLTTNETFKLIPFKDKKTKDTISAINNLLKKFN